MNLFFLARQPAGKMNVKVLDYYHLNIMRKKILN